MQNETAKSSVNDNPTTSDFLTLTIANQMFGIPVLQIEDVLGPQIVTNIPLAPPEVEGALNLRGRIVTAINMRKKLDLPRAQSADKNMSVVVEHDGELYSLIIDTVGDVISLQNGDFEKNPATLDPLWRDISAGIYRMENKLLLILDVAKFLNSVQHAEAIKA